MKELNKAAGDHDPAACMIDDCPACVDYYTGLTEGEWMGRVNFAAGGAALASGFAVASPAVPADVDVSIRPISRRLLARLQDGYYWYFEIGQEPTIVRLTKATSIGDDEWTMWFPGSEIDCDLVDALKRGSLGRRVKPPTR